MFIASSQDIRDAVDWSSAIAALRAGHEGPRPLVKDLTIDHGDFRLFGRGVILPGLGAGMKVASLNPPNAAENPPRPVEHGVFVVIDESTRELRAILDGPEVAWWKTAADSALASQYLSRPDSRVLLVLGAGPIARALIEAHLAIRPGIERILLWNRHAARAEALKSSMSSYERPITVIQDLNRAIGEANIIAAATGSTEPLIPGDRVSPGTHVDLVGSFQPGMRESDDALMERASIFVNYRNTTVSSAGDLVHPIANQRISESDILGDLFELVQGDGYARNDPEITVYKNGGGAHLDLMVSQHILARLQTADTRTRG